MSATGVWPTSSPRGTGEAAPIGPVHTGSGRPRLTTLTIQVLIGVLVFGEDLFDGPSGGGVRPSGDVAK